MKEELTNVARSLRQRHTDTEKKLWSRLRDRRLDGFKFKRQVPRGRYVVDFLCSEAGLVVEVDGGQHAEKEAERDRLRTQYLESEGLSVLRFWNNDILENLDGVLASIQNTLAKKPAPSPGAARHPLPSGERG